MTVLGEIHVRLFETWSAAYELDADDADPQLVFDLLDSIFAAVRANTVLAQSLGIDPYRCLSEEARRIMLSDGRSVWVDVDDPLASSAGLSLSPLRITTNSSERLGSSVKLAPDPFC